MAFLNHVDTSIPQEGECLTKVEYKAPYDGSEFGVLTLTFESGKTVVASTTNRVRSNRPLKKHSKRDGKNQAPKQEQHGSR